MFLLKVPTLPGIEPKIAAPQRRTHFQYDTMHFTGVTPRSDHSLIDVKWVPRGASAPEMSEVSITLRCYLGNVTTVESLTSRQTPWGNTPSLENDEPPGQHAMPHVLSLLTGFPKCGPRHITAIDATRVFSFSLFFSTSMDNRTRILFIRITFCQLNTLSLYKTRYKIYFN